MSGISEMLDFGIDIFVMFSEQLVVACLRNPSFCEMLPAIVCIRRAVLRAWLKQPCSNSFTDLLSVLIFSDDAIIV